MASKQTSNSTVSAKNASSTAKTIEDRENELILLAVDLAEKQLREGTAKSQVIVHYLKLGSTREKLEKEILKEQQGMLKAKTEALQSAKRVEELYSNAIKAFRSYNGIVDEENSDVL